MKFIAQLRFKPGAAPFLAALFIVLAYNFTFWKSFVGATGGLTLVSVPVQVGMFLLLVLSYNACLALVNFPYVLKPVLVLLFLATSAASYFMDQYGTAIDWSMIQNVVETNTRESSELLSWKLILTIAVLGVLPSLAVVKAKPRFTGGRRQVLSNAGSVAASLVLAAVLLVLMFKSLAPALREHRELRFLLTPTNYIQAVNGYYKRKWRRRPWCGPWAPTPSRASCGTARNAGR
ncbi:phosphoethanolamine transferase domain-containing protein [Massilia cavernae]|uniref:phosphoethanolamine transferase domain-containing protein n=1 Tax=Massilia cavernae TaxID=2320864 RepID=UPI001E325D1B|nr:DUF1705 domain-containing protein [Massilia cavernae]